MSFRKDVVRFLNLRNTDPPVAPSGSGSMQDVEMLDAPQIQAENDVDVEPIPVDLADEVEGMYRLIDLISESGSHGYGKEPFKSSTDILALFPLAKLAPS